MSPTEVCEVTGGSDLRQRVHFHDEVLLQAQEADDGEEVDEDERQQRRQQDGAAVTGDALYHVEQRLLAVDQVEQLVDTREGQRSGRHRVCV